MKVTNRFLLLLVLNNHSQAQRTGTSENGCYMIKGLTADRFDATDYQSTLNGCASDCSQDSDCISFVYDKKANGDNCSNFKRKGFSLVNKLEGKDHVAGWCPKAPEVLDRPPTDLNITFTGDSCILSEQGYSGFILYTPEKDQFYSGVPTKEDCQAICQLLDPCMFFNYLTHSKNCELKSGVGTAAPEETLSPDMIFGPKNCPDTVATTSTKPTTTAQNTNVSKTSPNAEHKSKDNSPVIAGGVSGGFFLLTLVAVGLFCLFRKRSSEPENEDPARQDANPIYGLYYFGGENGAKIDNEKIEVKDANDYYGT